MKRLLPLLAALAHHVKIGNKTDTAPLLNQTATKVHQLTLPLLDNYTKFVFDSYLPLDLDTRLNYYDQHKEALNRFVEALYRYCIKLNHNKNFKTSFIRDEIIMPFSLYLESLSVEDFDKVYESIMSVPPSKKHTKDENISLVTQNIMSKL